MATKCADIPHCLICSSDSNEKRIFCAFCGNWAHTKCAHLGGVKTENITNISWHCAKCFGELSAMQRLKSDVEVFKKELQEITSKAGKMIENVNEKVMEISNIGRKMNHKFHEKLEGVGNLVSEAIGGGGAESADSTIPQSGSTEGWSEVVKRKKKKNLLVVRPTELNKDLPKESISKALKDTQIYDTKFKKDKIVMNFENETLRNEAVEKLEHVSNVSTKTVRKLKPKLTLCNVHTEEESQDLVNTIVSRNEYLNTITDINNKIEIIFFKPAAGGTLHYVLKCDPEVRELIRKHNDRIKLNWGIYKVYDRYHAIICYHCQRYGHTEEKCTSKINKDESYCRKCAGRHNSKECNSTEKKCINCVRFNKQNVDHSANEQCCEMLKAEIDKLRNMTDHGY